MSLWANGGVERPNPGPRWQGLAEMPVAEPEPPPREKKTPRPHPQCPSCADALACWRHSGSATAGLPDLVRRERGTWSSNVREPIGIEAL